MIFDLSSPRARTMARLPTEMLSSSKRAGSILPILIERNERWSSSEKGTLRFLKDSASSLDSLTLLSSSLAASCRFLRASTSKRNFSAMATDFSSAPDEKAISSESMSAMLRKERASCNFRKSSRSGFFASPDLEASETFEESLL